MCMCQCISGVTMVCIVDFHGMAKGVLFASGHVHALEYRVRGTTYVGIAVAFSPNSVFQISHLT